MLGGISRSLVTRTVAIKPSFAVPIRNAHYESGPPRNRIPYYEKLACGAVIIASILAIPAWVVSHLDEYKTGGRK